MPQKSNEPKFNVTFWQLFTILVVAGVLGGVVTKFAFENMIQDEINSIDIRRSSSVNFQDQNTQINTIKKR